MTEGYKSRVAFHDDATKPRVTVTPEVAAQVAPTLAQYKQLRAANPYAAAKFRRENATALQLAERAEAEAQGFNYDSAGPGTSTEGAR